MRTVKDLAPDIPKETDLVNWPDSNVVNETETDAGTPVVREIYGDVLANLYNLLRVTKVTATGEEDSNANGYQLVDALRRLTNSLNDVEQQLNLSGTVFSIGFDLTILPDKYFCLVKPVADYVAGLTYTFKGSDNNPLGFTSPTGFKTGDEVLLIIDHAGVRAYSLNSLTNTIPEVFSPFGTPLAYNGSNKIWYQSEGVLYSDLPEAYDLQAAIRTTAGDGTLLVYEMLLIQNYVLCLVLAPNTLHYSFYRFAAGSFATPLAQALTGSPFPTGTVTNDYKPNVYTDGTNLYISNSTGNSANDYRLNKYTVDMAAGTITASGSIVLDSSFEKTTNAVIKGSYLYTFVGGVLVQYNLASGVRTYGASFPGYIGLLFGLNGNIYYSNGEVGKKWSIPIY